MDPEKKYFSRCGMWQAVFEKVRMIDDIYVGVWVVRTMRDELVDIAMYSMDLEIYHLVPAE